MLYLHNPNIFITFGYSSQKVKPIKFTGMIGTIFIVYVVYKVCKACVGGFFHASDAWTPDK